MFDGIFREAEDKESLEKILAKLLDSKDIELKSEIHSPLALDKLKILSVWLESEKMPESAKLINTFIEYYLKYMVSHNRESRKEIIHALSEMIKREVPLSEKIMGEKIQ